MKFKVDNKSHGQVMKATIMDIVKDIGFVSLYDVDSIVFDHPVRNLENKKLGWSYMDLAGKVRVRKTKSGWWLYLPEPTKVDADPCESDEVVYSLTEEELAYIIHKAVYVNSCVLRPCLVIRKVKGKKKEERARFHCWFQSTMPDKDKVIQQALGIVEFEDGRIQNVKPTSIRFTDDFWEVH